MRARILRKGVQALVISAVFSAATPVLATQGEAFSIATESLPPLAEGTAQAPSSLLRLKQQAVREYLQRILGPRYERYDASVTPDFAERYILDYRVVRQSPDSMQMEIEGHLDTLALKEWVRISETKAAGSNFLKPLFLISAELPNFKLNPRQSAELVKQNPIAQTLFRQLSEGFVKFNTTLQTSEDSGLGMDRPPSGESELRTLRSYGVSAGFNSAVWVHFSACRGCGTRLDFLLFNLNQARQVESISVDVETDPSELADPKKLLKVAGKAIRDFGTKFEDSVSQGTLFASEYRVVVEGINSYKTFKAIDSALGKQDFILQSSLSRSGKSVAEFRILSPLPPRELFQRFGVAQFPGMTLKPLRIDSQTVVMRYLN